MANLVSDPLGVPLTSSETTVLRPPVAKNSTDSAYVKKNLDAYEVRSGTCPVDSPPFANLLNQVTSIKMDHNNFLLWQNIALPILHSYKLEGHFTGFLQTNIFFCRVGIHRAIISDQGSHFCNRTVEALLKKFEVHHRVATPYHPQTNGQRSVK